MANEKSILVKMKRTVISILPNQRQTQNNFIEIAAASDEKEITKPPWKRYS